MDDRTRPVSVTPFGRLVTQVDDRAGSRDLELMSVSIDHGVRRRLELTDGEPRADDLSNYKVCAEGDIVLNRMRAFQGAVGLAPQEGLVSPDYAVLRAESHVDAKYVAYLMRSRWFVGQMTARLRGIGDPELGAVRTPRVNVADLGDIRVTAPTLGGQRRIADFLDDRVTRIDQIITAREAQLELIHESADRASFEVISGHRVVGARRTVEERWLGTIPAGWPLLSVGSEFQVELGKMLDEKQQTGKWPLPYLRNTNVQWDVISTDDVKIMDIAPHERSRFTVTPGDLLICEGGQPGRAAIWAGGIAPLAYQKALHRARSRGRSHPRWLLECLRVAVRFGVFEAANGQTTIGHLTNEQLRAQRFPFPDTKTQSDLLTTLSADREAVSATSSALTQSVALLREYKQVLITAAVTGELDVTTAGSGIPG